MPHYPDDPERDDYADILFNPREYIEYTHLEMSHLRQIPTSELERMVRREPLSPDTLRIIDRKFKPDPIEQPAPAPPQPALRPLTLSEAMDLYPDFKSKPKRKRGMAPRLYKAQLKHEGKNVYLGSFYTDIEAYAAVQQAKFRRSVGLPIK